MNKEKLLDLLCKKYPQLNGIKDSIDKAAATIIKCYTRVGKLLICGNGGSSADADHIAGELMKSFESDRSLDDSMKNRLIEICGSRGKFLAEKLEHGLPAISLTAHSALTSAIANDMGAPLVFAQQIIGYGMENDVLLAISTSGNSQNIIDACITAKALNLNVIGITGKTGGKMKQYCDVLVNVPEIRTSYVQELHLPLLHTICNIVENHFYGK
jgi:phosphoheptose isomerase